MDKTPNDARGAKINCHNFSMCPFCYGCRNYSSVDPECQICLAENKKRNLCDTSKHKPELISKMIKKTTINVEGI